MTISNKLILRTIAVLWFIWALFHVIPGIISIMAALDGDISFIQNLEPQTTPQQLTSDYPTEVFAFLVIYAQHSYNLFWFGLVTFVCAVYIWRQPNQTALLVAAIVGGLADLGVIFFIDLFGGYGSLFGKVITAVAFTAIGLSIFFVARNKAET